MNKYLCYIFFDENWSAYYVGKGSCERRIRQRHDVIIPPAERVQVFYFANEWEAFECERELIAFWGRECDGGCLQNKSTGGTIGPLGFSHSKETKERLSKSHTGKKSSEETRIKIGNVHRGKVISIEQRAKISATRKKRGLGNEHMTALKRKPITVRNITTGEVKQFRSQREASRALHIHIGTLKKLGKTKDWALV